MGILRWQISVLRRLAHPQRGRFAEHPITLLLRLALSLLFYHDAHSCRQIIGQQRYNKSVDWYALGVLIYEMLTGLPPYHQAQGNPAILYEKISAGPEHIRWPTSTKPDETFPPLARDLIMKLMEGDPSKRYGNMQHGAGDVFAHPWFREVDWYKLSSREITAPFLPKINGDGDASA